jgi:hypothetical protein
MTSERSVERGKHDSEALRREPEASWISRIRTPPLPIMEPIKMCGMRRRNGYVFDWGVEGSSRASWLSVRMIRPNAFEQFVSIHSLEDG